MPTWVVPSSRIDASFRPILAPPTTTIPDASDRLDVRMHHREGSIVLIVVRDCPRDPESVPGDRVQLWPSGGRRALPELGNSCPRGSPDTSQSSRGSRSDWACKPLIIRWTLAHVRVGIRCGRLQRSSRPALLSAAFRSIHAATHRRMKPVGAVEGACGQQAQLR